MQPDKKIFDSVIKITDAEFNKLSEEQKIAEKELLELFTLNETKEEK